MKRRTLYIFLSLFIFLSCRSRTELRQKVVEFRTDASTIESSLLSIVDCEKINIEGIEAITGNTVTSKLVINITNGHDLPKAKNDLKLIAKSVAIKVQDFLIRKNDFLTYQIFFNKVKKFEITYDKEFIAFTFLSSEF
jgi:hypothetical protein